MKHVSCRSPNFPLQLKSPRLLRLMIPSMVRPYNNADGKLLINFVPLFGLFWALFENGFMPGTSGGNRYGEDPLSAFSDA